MDNNEEKDLKFEKNKMDKKGENHFKFNPLQMITIIGSISMIACIIFLLSVHFFSPSTKSEITADGILEYFVGALAFISTLILSGLALWQTHKIQTSADESQRRMEKMANDANEISKRMESLAKEANDISERMELITNDANNISRKMLEIEEYNYQLNIRPFINVGHFSMQSFGAVDINNNNIWVEINGKLVGGCGKYPSIVISLINTTNSVITVEYDGATSEDCTWTNAQINPQSLKHIIKSGETKNIVFFARDSFLEELRGKRVTLSFILENRFAQRYREQFDLVFSTITRDKKHNWHYMFHTQNFKMIKYSVDENGEEIEIAEKL